MMETKFERTTVDDEVDLGKVFFKFIFLLKRKSKILIISSILGLSLGLIYYLISPPTYYSSMTISTGMLTTFNSKSLFNTLSTLISEQNYNELAKKLNLHNEEVMKIKSISVVSLTRDEEDPDKSNLFMVETHITDQEILNRLESGIINYLEENPYVKKRIDLKKKNLNLLLSKIDEEMLGLDNLKENLSSNLNSSRENNVLILDPVNTYKETVNLFEKRLNLQSELELIDNIQVIENFTVYNKKVSPRLRFIIFGLIGGFMVGVTLILLLEFISYSQKQEFLQE